MKNIRSLYVVMLMALLLIGGLVACSSDKPEDEGETNQNETTESEGEATGEISGELEIQYFVGGYGDAWWKETIANFKEKYPDVTIVEHAGPNVNKEMQTRWIANNPPDLVYLGGADMNEATMIDDGLLMDITDWINEVELDDGSLLIDEFL